MEKPEILGGLKAAIERGYTLEQAKQSFINAGYNIVDVEDSSQALTGVLGKIPQAPLEIKPLQQPSQIQPQPIQQPPQIPSKPQTQQITQPQPAQPQQPIQAQGTQTPGKKSIGLIILVVFLVIIFIALLGVLIGMLFFKEKMAEILTPLLSKFSG